MTELVSGVWLIPVILVLMQSKESQSQGNSGHGWHLPLVLAFERQKQTDVHDLLNTR